MKTYTHPTLTEVADKLENKSIDVAAIWATGFHCEYRHYVITDDGERVLISDRDHDLLNLYDESLRAAYRELGLLFSPAKLARKREEIWARLADSRPVITPRRRDPHPGRVGSDQRGTGRSHAAARLDNKSTRGRVVGPATNLLGDKTMLQISDFEITATYGTLACAMKSAHKFGEKAIAAKAALETARADATLAGRIDGKNEAQREAAARLVLADEYDIAETAESRARLARHELDLARLSVEELKARLRLAELLAQAQGEAQ